jgi:hypothetical protein
VAIIALAYSPAMWFVNYLRIGTSISFILISP